MASSVMAIFAKVVTLDGAPSSVMELRVVVVPFFHQDPLSTPSSAIAYIKVIAQLVHGVTAKWLDDPGSVKLAMTVVAGMAQNVSFTGHIGRDWRAAVKDGCQV
ncbi:hypothetical protein BX600DRAFT_54757 [Xylariales sp. PMI_506]|nr:hypothetical protein BX600DRAFT_54757 [Xylariales sp. PMI_506]